MILNRPNAWIAYSNMVFQSVQFVVHNDTAFSQTVMEPSHYSNVKKKRINIEKWQENNTTEHLRV